MKSALRYLADAAPVWFFVDKLSSDALLGSARVSKTPWEKNGLRLHIFGNPKPKAREEVPGTDLPIRCPERHIQGDQTFCLGLRYIDVRCADDAVQWWEQLRQYLACQGVAALRRGCRDAGSACPPTPYLRWQSDLHRHLGNHVVSR